MRPTIDHLLDTDIQIWRPTTTQDDIGVDERGYTPTSVVQAKLNIPTTPVEAVQGGGMAEVLRIRWYGRPDIDVLARDVCEVISGPETGKTFEVNAQPVRPKEHHTQVDCIEWHGTLPVES